MLPGMLLNDIDHRSFMKISMNRGYW